MGLHDHKQSMLLELVSILEVMRRQSPDVGLVPPLDRGSGQVTPPFDWWRCEKSPTSGNARSRTSPLTAQPTNPNRSTASSTSRIGRRTP